MGFKAVYEILKEIFPLVDARVLKAVAIEHSRDIDAAVNDVLFEVIPYMNKRIISPSTLPNNSSPRALSNKGDVQDEEKKILKNKQGVVQAETGPSELRFVGFEESNDVNYVPDPDKVPLNGALDKSQSEVSNFYDANDVNDQSLQGISSIRSIWSLRSNEMAELFSMINSKEYSSEVPNYTPPIKSNSAVLDDGEIDDLPSNDNESYEEITSETFGDFGIEIGAKQRISLVNMPNLVHEKGNGEIANEDVTSLNVSAVEIDCGISHEVESHVDSVLQEVYHPVDLLILPAAGKSDPVSSECQTESEFDSEKPLCGSLDLTVNLDCSVTSGIEEELTYNSLETRSDQLYKVDFLEAIVEVAKNNKKTLFSAMETVMNMMKEVEVREKAAEQAQKEAANGGLDILVKVEELKQMLVRAKEANDMHAGEVYGEKAILATEARELQSRLLNLSDERDKYLQILDEMRQSLEVRLAMAEEMRNAAEQEKTEKEEYARKALIEQEAFMEKVVEESKMLQEEAEENSKLQEFLVDRGHIVDKLQGEISVICQDVKLLKEKFDDRVPFSKSLSSSQTSCILASSTSSQKSTASDLVYYDSSTKDVLHNSGTDQNGRFNNSNKRSPASSINGSKPDHRFEKDLEEEGWDILDEIAELGH